jgi:membrane protease YdiL (CAAX protease family)
MTAAQNAANQAIHCRLVSSNVRLLRKADRKIGATRRAHVGTAVALDARVATLLVLLSVWSLLVAAPLLAPALGGEGSVLAVQLAAAALLVATRTRRRVDTHAPIALGIAAGYASFPAWVLLAISAGLALGLAPVAGDPPLHGGPLAWASGLVAAPLFEELLYRERIFDALRARLGAIAAVAATSALFAAPHLAPWQVLATFFVGIGLGALRACGAPIGVCIAVHAGLNLASLLGGSPPVQLALPPLVAAGVGGAAAAGALAFARALPTPERDAWANRAVTVVLVSAFLVATHAFLPDPDERGLWQYFVVVTIGYGHLYGAAVFARARRRRREPLRTAFVAVSAISGLASYAALSRRIEGFFLPFLVASVWHTVENDLALAGAYRNGMKLGGLPRDPTHHLLSIGVAALVTLLVGLTPTWQAYTEGAGGVLFAALGREAVRVVVLAAAGALLLRRGGARSAGAVLAALACGAERIAAHLTFADVFAAATLYHLFSWLLLFGERTHRLARAGDRAGARALAARLFWVHAPLAALCIALWSVPASALAPIRELVFSPGIYLFWSFLHVVQTSWSRGLMAPRGVEKGSVPLLDT